MGFVGAGIIWDRLAAVGVRFNVIAGIMKGQSVSGVTSGIILVGVSVGSKDCSPSIGIIDGKYTVGSNVEGGKHDDVDGFVVNGGKPMGGVANDMSTCNPSVMDMSSKGSSRVKYCNHSWSSIEHCDGG